jgi:manganese efflux pump family protein
VLALLLLAAALGLSNFAAAIGIGVSGVRGRARVQIAVVFGVLEAGMPVLGVALGQGVAAEPRSGRPLARRGSADRDRADQPDPGLERCLRSTRRPRRPPRRWPGRVGGPGPREDGSSWRLGRTVVSGLAPSVDNLAAGFALGASHTGLALAATVFGVVSVIMTLAGLELGARLGASAGNRSELIASVMLIAVGIAVAAGVF